MSYLFRSKYDTNLRIVPPTRKPIDNLIDKFILHPQWYEDTMSADIALIRLNKNIVYTGTAPHIFHRVYIYKDLIVNLTLPCINV
jgi:hypothetical protein